MNFKKMLSILLVGVLCLSLFSGCGENNTMQSNTTTTNADAVSGRTITVVSHNENNGFYGSLKKGAEDAAKKYGFSLNYLGVDETAQSPLSFHIANLEKTLDSDASGVVITTMGKGYSEILSRFFDAKIPVVLVDNIDESDVERLEEVNKNPIASTVSTSCKEAGALCAEKLFERVKEDIKKSRDVYVIGVIEREEANNDEEKSKGFEEKFSELADANESTKGKYKIETEEGTDSLEELMAEGVKAVFMTHPEIADKISDTVFADKEKYKDITFCGFDSGAKQMKWLESKDGAEFIGGVAQDSYNLGYNAVEQCIFSVQSKEVKPDIKIEGNWYDKANAEKMKQDGIIFEK